MPLPANQKTNKLLKKQISEKKLVEKMDIAAPPQRSIRETRNTMTQEGNPR